MFFIINKKVHILLLLFLTISGCATTNYYTGRTLEDGKTVLTPGIDNLIWIDGDDGLVDKDFYVNPSLGIARGLPMGFEVGIRYILPYFLETNLRYQLNPKSFDLFDVSANLHVGVFLANENISDPYYKYGLTISKEIFYVQPYLSYYLYTNYFVRNDSDKSLSNSTTCFGLAIPYDEELIFLECNYFNVGNNSKGIFAFGIGLRASIGNN